jgi:hypothetical protein
MVEIVWDELIVEVGAAEEVVVTEDIIQALEGKAWRLSFVPEPDAQSDDNMV